MAQAAPLDTSVVSDDPRYASLYDVESEAKHLANAIAFDPNPHFARLLAQAPVHSGGLMHLMGAEEHNLYVTNRPRYCVLGYDLVNAMFRDNETFSSRLYREMTGHPMLGDTILNKVGSDHRRHRAVAQPMFMRIRAFDWWKPNWIQGISDTLMAHLATFERVDLNQQLCARLPIHTITRAFGIGGDAALEFRFHLIRGVSSSISTAAERTESVGIVNAMLLERIAARRTDPQDDVISGLMTTPLELEDGSRRPMTDAEIQAYARLILLAGGGTTWRQLGITIHALITHPAQFEMARDDRRLVDAAIEEALRWNPTDPVFNRVTTRDVEFGGVMIPEGSLVEGCLGAANRDPSRWERPEAFDITRAPQPHLGFTAGPHLCLGRDVARAEMTVALNALMDHFPRLRLDPDAPAPRLAGGLEQRGMSAIPVVLH